MEEFFSGSDTEQNTGSGVEDVFASLTDWSWETPSSSTESSADISTVDPSPEYGVEYEDTNPDTDADSSGDDTGCSEISFACTTHANFSYTSSKSYSTSATRGGDGCEGEDCVHVRGSATLVYTVSTSVSPLPSVSDYPRLKPCQTRNLREAIEQLRQHEAEHERRFRTYAGTQTLTLDFVAIGDAVEERIEEMIATAAEARQTAAQAHSDAIDPFEVLFDCDCQD